VKHTLLALVALAALLALPAAAQEVTVTQSGATLRMQALDHRFTLPLPDWLSAAERLNPDVLALVEDNTYADPRQAFVEFFPAGQTAQSWTTTYAARLTLDPERPLEDYRQATIYGYSQTCNEQLAGSFSLGPDSPGSLAPLVYVCGAYKSELTSLRGQGQVLLAVFRKTEAGVGMVYQEWKGPVFDPADPATWPVGRAALEARASQLRDQVQLVVATGT